MPRALHPPCLASLPFPALLLPLLQALKPYFVKITGPLIRVVADKFPWAVKAAILKTLREVGKGRRLGQ